MAEFLLVVTDLLGLENGRDERAGEKRLVFVLAKVNLSVPKALPLSRQRLTFVRYEVDFSRRGVCFLWGGSSVVGVKKSAPPYAKRRWGALRVPRAGIEPARTFVHWCLRPTRLPIPPSGLTVRRQR